MGSCRVKSEPIQVGAFAGICLTSRCLVRWHSCNSVCRQDGERPQHDSDSESADAKVRTSTRARIPTLINRLVRERITLNIMYEGCLDELLLLTVAVGSHIHFVVFLVHVPRSSSFPTGDVPHISQVFCGVFFGSSNHFTISPSAYCSEDANLFGFKLALRATRPCRYTSGLSLTAVFPIGTT